MPVLPTAPTLEKRTKLATVPKSGVCAKITSGKDNRETPTKIVGTILVFMVLDLIILFVRNMAGK
jgi:hypothetical protein